MKLMVSAKPFTAELKSVLPAVATRSGLPMLSGVRGEDVATEPQDEPEPYTLEHLVADSLLPIDTLEEWISLLQGPKKQAIFYGPPGTSKMLVARRLAEFLAGTLERVLTIQFHSSFSYEDFIEGLRPEAEDRGGGSAGIRYEVRPGVFQEFCDRARAHLGATYVCVIDEINRADLGSVLGELMYLLEYRGSSIQLPYSKRRLSLGSSPPPTRMHESVVGVVVQPCDRYGELEDARERRSR